MPLGFAVLALLTVAPSVAPEPARDVATAPARAQLEHAFVRSEGIAAAAVLDAVRLRAAHVQWSTFGEAVSAPKGMTAVVQLRVAPAGHAELTIIVSDGRAFDRTVEMAGLDEGEWPRLAASTIASLVAGIEAGTIVADRDDVPLPVPSEPQCPAVAAPPCPAIVDDRRTIPPATTPPSTRPAVQPRHAVGVSAQLPVVLGLGPPADADRFAAWGGSAGVRARLRRGATFGIEVRSGGRSSVGDVRLFRNRFAFGAGYTLRRGALELSATAWGTVEPWVVRIEGQRATFTDGQSRERALIGGALRVEPGLRWTPARGTASFRVGPVVELSVSGTPADRFRAPRIVLPSEEASRIRVGGTELSVGVQLVAWFPVG